MQAHEGNGRTAPLTLNLGTRCHKRLRYLLNGKVQDSRGVTDVSVKVRRYKNEGREVRGQPSGNCPSTRVEQEAWVTVRSQAGPFGEEKTTSLLPAIASPSLPIPTEPS